MSQRRREAGRDISGIVLLDKPSGITSNAALQTVKRLFQARKAGHTGSLDPLADGLLPVCLGEATKLSGFLLEADKRYRTVIRLGSRTTTGDAEGEPLGAPRDFTGIDRVRVDAAVARFTGAIAQTPPMHSALKQNGVPLYKLARQGIEVERQPRNIVIRSIEVLRFEGDQLEIDVHCSKGTYIRVLAEEIGEALGCGAHVSVLRRTGVGGFDACRMITLETLRGCAASGTEALDAVLVSMDDALMQLPDVRLTQEVAFFIRRGQPVFVPHAPAQGLVRMYTGEEDRFLGVGCILEDGRVAPKRLVNC